LIYPATDFARRYRSQDLFAEDLFLTDVHMKWSERALPHAPQVLDHLVFGAVAGVLLDRPHGTDQRTTSTTSPGCSEL
ncbi:hypothetical protein AB0J40_40060, partial [Amycolatopsis sp. NPDC049691]